jgi:hypothetical protein
MLRVITERREDGYQLELHGMLGGEWVPVLEEHWRSIVDDAPLARVTVVLSYVDFIDPGGEQLLLRMAESGATFVVSGCMNRYVVDKLLRYVRATDGLPRRRFERLRGSASGP